MHDAFKDGSQQSVRTSTGSGEALGTVPCAQGSAPQLWIVEFGAISLPFWHPSRITCFQLHESEQAAQQSMDAMEFNARMFAVVVPPLGNQPVQGTVKPGDCVHCGKELCNDLGWCNSFKAAASPASGALAAASLEVLPASPVPNVQDPSSEEGQAQHQAGSAHLAAPSGHVPSAAPLSSPLESDRSELPRGPSALGQQNAQE